MTKEHRWTVDAIEDHTARISVEGKGMMHVPHWMLPRGARKGDVLAVKHEVTAEHAVLRIDRDDATREA
jgi:hypothetical protein